MPHNLQPSIWLMISRGSPQTSRPQRGTWFSAVKKQRRTSKYCGACKLAFPHQCKQVRQDNQPSKMTLQKLLPKQSSSTILELSACVGPEWATWVSNIAHNVDLVQKADQSKKVGVGQKEGEVKNVEDVQGESSAAAPGQSPGGRAQRRLQVKVQRVGLECKVPWQLELR